MKTNIWALKRDNDIKHFMLEVERILGNQAFLIHASEDGHPKSIELLSNEDKRIKAYVFTFGQETGRFGLILDYPVLEDNNLSSTETAYDDIGLENLIDLLAMHFDVSY